MFLLVSSLAASLTRRQAEPIIQLCHYKDYVDKIMQKHKEMLDERTTSLGESLKNLINRLVDVDYSPYLEVGTFEMLCQAGLGSSTPSCKLHWMQLSACAKSGR